MDSSRELTRTFPLVESRGREERIPTSGLLYRRHPLIPVSDIPQLPYRPASRAGGYEKDPSDKVSEVVSGLLTSGIITILLAAFGIALGMATVHDKNVPCEKEPVHFTDSR